MNSGGRRYRRRSVLGAGGTVAASGIDDDHEFVDLAGEAADIAGEFRKAEGFPVCGEDCVAARGVAARAGAVAGEVDEGAVVVAEAGASPDGDEIKLYVKENLARHKVPRDVVFIDELPRNATGKLLRRVLVEMEVDD